MKEKKQVEFKLVRKNSYGHRFILEPRERIKFREKCKHYKYGCCEKGYTCYIDGGVLLGCTPDVYCPRLEKWDKKHGLERPYTMVENKYPDMKPTTFTWHPATESPGKKRVVMAFKVKGHENSHCVFETVRFLSPNVTPASCTFTNEEGVKQLPIAWAYYDEIAKGIEDWMFERAKSEAWAWWPDNKKENENK